MIQNPTAAQTALLTAASANGGTIGIDAARRTTVTAAVKNGWLFVTEEGDESRVTITPAGRVIIGAPAPSRPGPKGKIGILVALMQADGGATIEAMTAATGWQAHSVRGAIAGAIKKSAGLAVTSQKTEAGRVYSIPPAPEA